jgi:small subunit ribosomal protein S6e
MRCSGGVILMAEFKLVLGFKEGKCVQREVKDQDASIFIGKKIGDKVEGSAVGLEGYEFEITGGSDKVGFPMRKDVAGSARKRILAVSGKGLKKKAKGVRQRKAVAGNTLHSNISQINLKVLKVGKENLLKAAEKKEGAEGGEGKEEAPAEKKEEKKEAPVKKEEAKPEDKKEAKKEEPKKEKPAAKEEKPKEEKKD